MNTMNTIDKNFFHYLRNRISHIISKEECEILVHIFLISRLDYCNVTHENTTYLAVQNYAARLILRYGRSEHLTPLLYYLHWLPVELRDD